MFNLLYTNSLLAIDTPSIIMLAVLAVLVIGLFVFSNFQNKKRRSKYNQELELLKPGNKVKTVGGVCGVVVEIDRDENTFVLETGSKEKTSYVKFTMEAVLQTDVQLPTPSEASTEKKPEQKKTDKPKENIVDDKKSND